MANGKPKLNRLEPNEPLLAHDQDDGSARETHPTHGEIELRILRDSLPNSKSLGDACDSVPECTELNIVAEHELNNAKKAIRFLSEIRKAKRQKNDSAGTSPSDAESENAAGDPTFADHFEGGPGQLPSSIGRFETIRLLGQGGFAKVFLCRDENLNRLVAIKVPKPHALIFHESRHRFKREAHAAAMLSHPSIVPVFENDSSGPITFIVSAYCEGTTLAEWIEDNQEQLTPRHAARIIWRLSEAIEYAHQRGVIHRDLKPGNILVESDFSYEQFDLFGPDGEPESNLDISHRVRITDFGLAKYTDSSLHDSLTAEGAVIGTPAYMSPEQARGEKNASTPADLFALGTILYEMLTGTLPFKRTSNVATLRAIEEDEPKAPTAIVSTIHKDLEAICLKCLEKHPSRRYASAHALHRDLGLWLEGRPVVARRPTKVERVYAWYRRNPALAAALTFAFLSLTIGFSTALWQRGVAQTNLAANSVQRQRAERNALTLMSTIDEVLDDYVHLLDSGEKIDDVELGMLDKMLVAHKMLIDQEAEHLDVSLDTLQAYQRLASVYQKTSKSEDARAICAQAVELWEMVRDPELKLELAPTIFNIKFEEVLVDINLDESGDAETLLKEMCGFLEEYRDGFDEADWKASMFSVNRHLGLTLIAQSKNFDASRFLTDAWQSTVTELANYPASKQLKKRHSLALQDLGEHAMRLGNNKDALKYFESAIKQLEEFKDDSAQHRFRDAYLLSDVAAMNAAQGYLEKAEDQFDRSVELLEVLAKEQSGDSSYSRRLTHTLLRQGIFLESAGEPKFALDVFEKALADLLTRPGDSGSLKVELEIRARLGTLYFSYSGNAESSIELLEEAANIGELGVMENPDDSFIRKGVAGVYNALSQTRLESDDLN